jgi:hypothetical protein
VWQSLFGLVGPGAKVNIKLNGYDDRLKKEVSSGKGTTHLLPIYEAHEVRLEDEGGEWEARGLIHLWVGWWLYYLFVWGAGPLLTFDIAFRRDDEPTYTNTHIYT